jgi:PAS domain S-box-containing protein/diguanylate cyclase (GGDEF)-like protein
MVAQWVVVLEVAREPTAPALDAGAFYNALDALAETRMTVLRSDDRCAVQMEIGASGPAEALFSALARWTEAVRALTVAHWDVVRAELLTPEELERDLELMDAEGLVRPGVLDAAPLPRPPAEERLGEDLLREVFYDELTGLARRGLFLDRVERALARGEGRRQAVLFIDLDDFREINERLGPSGGDALLVAVARRIGGALDGTGTAARLGGDQFAVVLEDSAIEAAIAVAERIVDQLQRPFDTSATTVAVGASIGIALSQPGQDAEHLILNAGTAVCVAKTASRGRWTLFRSDMPGPDAVRLEVGADLNPDRLACVLLLERAAAAANECDTFEAAVRVVLQHFCAQTGWSVGHVYRRTDDPEAELVSSGIWHLPAPERYREFQEMTDAMPFVASVGLPGRVLAAGRPVWIRNIRHDPNCPRSSQAIATGLKAAVGFPVLVGHEVVAVVEFFGHEPAEPSQSLLEVLASVGTQLGRMVERERAQEALRRSEERFRSLAHSAADAIISTDAAGTIVSWNRGAERLFGHSEEEVVGRSLTMLMPERYRAAHSKGIAHFLATGESRVIGRTLRLEGLRRDGTEFRIDLSISSWETHEGRFVTGIIREAPEAAHADQPREASDPISARNESPRR